MLSTNPFLTLSETISPLIMQYFVSIMIFLVFAGTLYDVIHKKSGIYFFSNWKKAKKNRTIELNFSKYSSITLNYLIEVFTSGELCNLNRRIAHLLGMYGFIIYITATIILVFKYTGASSSADPNMWTYLWYLGASMISVGGLWFWIFIRVDVSAEGNSVFRLVQADLFVTTLVLSAISALLWSMLQYNGNPFSYLFLASYLLLTTLLFGTIPWSKFAHMFYKPAAALQKKIAMEDGSRNNLPEPANKPAILGKSLKPKRNY